MKNLITLLLLVLTFSSCQKETEGYVSNGVWLSEDGRYQFLIGTEGDVRPVYVVQRGDKLIFTCPMYQEIYDITAHTDTTLQLKSTKSEIIKLKKL
jgi:hypothetical protein